LAPHGEESSLFPFHIDEVRKEAGLDDLRALDLSSRNGFLVISYEKYLVADNQADAVNGDLDVAVQNYGAQKS
jgi:hypothetical protein